MHKNVKVRFFLVLRHKKAQQSADDTFTIIKTRLDADENLEKEISDGVFLQMDRLDKNDNIWYGEISRHQKTNFPHEVTDEGPKPLSTENNLGHSVAFLFDPSSSCLAIQFDTHIVSPSRLISYLKEFGGNALWVDAILRQHIISKLKNYKAKKIEVGVASPRNFAAIGDEEIESTFNSLAEAYGGAKIKVVISAERGGFLKDTVLPLIGNIIGNEDLRNLKVTTDQPTDHEDHELNLIKEMVSEDKDLSIDDRDPDARFAKCIGFVSEAYTMHKSYITSVYSGE